LQGYYERGIGVGILISQLPPVELARLKAELAETLISNFCYPRFYDFRTDTLRMRPVDRAKRQEVWQYLGSIDFNTWGRIDLMSPDLQRQVERLLIYFVQRNRTFFGEQGRKRMIDIRMLISTSSTSIVEGLRGHLTGRSKSFGNPRPVTSWVNSNITKRPEPTWEQLATPTMLLQQQLQEVRGEIKAAVNDARPNGASPNHANRNHADINATSAIDTEILSNTNSTTSKSSPQVEADTSTPLEFPKITNPLASPVSINAPSATSTSSVETSESKNGQVIMNEETLHSSVSKKVSDVDNIPNKPQKQTWKPDNGSMNTPAIIQPREITKAQPAAQTDVTSKEQESTTVLVGEEDVVIFEQMRHQLVVWTRVEAVRAGIEIAGREPAELLELLQQSDDFDETRLQITSTLIDLCDQIIAAGHANLLEYKQAIMFYLMHTRSTR
jgi:hypothetical protein